MKHRPPPLAAGWAKLATVALDRVTEAVSSSQTRCGKARLFKVEVRRARGQLHLLWLLQPEDSELVQRLREVRQRLAATSIETCEVCGQRVPRQEPRRNEVLCEAHDAPF